MSKHRKSKQNNKATPTGEKPPNIQRQQIEIQQEVIQENNKPNQEKKVSVNQGQDLIAYEKQFRKPFKSQFKYCNKGVTWRNQLPTRKIVNVAYDNIKVKQKCKKQQIVRQLIRPHAIKTKMTVKKGETITLPQKKKLYKKKAQKLIRYILLSIYSDKDMLKEGQPCVSRLFMLKKLESDLREDQYLKYEFIEQKGIKAMELMLKPLRQNGGLKQAPLAIKMQVVQVLYNLNLQREYILPLKTLKQTLRRYKQSRVAKLRQLAKRVWEQWEVELRLNPNISMSKSMPKKSKSKMMQLNLKRSKSQKRQS